MSPHTITGRTGDRTLGKCRFCGKYLPYHKLGCPGFRFEERKLLTAKLKQDISSLVKDGGDTIKYQSFKQ